ncbi:MAG: sortase [Anaerolineae bacterium]
MTRPIYLIHSTIVLLGISALVLIVGQARAQSTTTISIPALDIETVVVQAPLTPDYTTWDVSQLFMNVGHLVGTSWFGQGSNIVLGGHSLTPEFAPDIFYNLHALQVGDLIVVETDGIVRQYTVNALHSVDQFDVRVVLPTPHEQLTLITCQRGTYNSQSGQYQNRLVVVAVPI